MSARSIRRASERQARKLARKNLSEPRPQEAATAAHRYEPNPELLDEFTPEFLAEGQALMERIERKAGLRLASEPRPQEVNAHTEPLDFEPDASPTRPIYPADEPAVLSEAKNQKRLAANRANSQLSCGPRSTEGKEKVSFNALRHGLTGRFKIMPYESEHDYQELLDGLRDEHLPSTPTEHLLVDSMAQHYFLSWRAQYLHSFCFNDEVGYVDHEEHLALFLRYQTTHERAFHKALNDLLKLRAEKRKAEIGFVSQQHKVADQMRREAREKRQQERHAWAVLFDSAKLDHQNLLNRQLPGGVEFVDKSIQKIIALEKQENAAA